MKKFLLFLLILILLLFLYCFFFRKGGCCIGRGQKPDTANHWVNWNVLFTPASVGDAPATMKQFEDSLRKYITDSNSAAILKFTYHHCPCDTLLTNMDVTAIYPSGNPVSPPPTKPPIGPSGDFTVGNNFMTYTPEFKDSVKTDTPGLSQYNVHITTQGSKSSKLLAVIDTGLDSVGFQHAHHGTIWVGDMLWKDPLRDNTIYDVVLGENTGDLRDQTKVRHGTAVTEIVLNQLHLLHGQTPKIMSIRAFDDSEIGSIYTVSCALSYAIQNNANFINASWGYFGSEDSVLLKYLLKANAKNIPVIAAAGNTPGIHDPGQVCNAGENTLNFLNRLKTKDSLFYPAAFAPIIPNLVSVTQLHNISNSPDPSLQFFPCYYQNYSSDFITVGAFDNTQTNTYQCCKFTAKVYSETNPIEGSSFATPAITARLMNDFSVGATDIKSFININSSKSTSAAQFTLKGSYYTFVQLP